MIEKSKEHVKKALELANEAKFEADMAIQQSKEYEKVWPTIVPK